MDKKKMIGNMLRKYKASDTLVQGTLNMLEGLDESVRMHITIRDFIEILDEINHERNCKQIDRLSKKDFS